MQPIVWIGFIVLVAIMMAVDLGIFNRTSHTLTPGQALRNTLIWIGLAALFNVFIYYAYNAHWWDLGWYIHEPMDGTEAALKFLTGYLLEEALSVDNLFVMALVFAQFAIPQKHQHRILFWGIIGVLVFRGALIGAGIWLVHYFKWLFAVFGLLLLWSAWKMWRSSDDDPKDLHDHGVVRFIHRFYPVSRKYGGGKFFLVENGKRFVTPMFVALVVIETTDILFAFDSVPAVFSITTDPFLVFSSNIFAILGLRSLYFLLAGMLDRFKRLHHSLVFILFFIGVKMLLIPFGVHIPIGASLGFIGLALAVGVWASVRAERRDNA